MNPPKELKNSDLKYISEERKKEVEQVFQTLGILQKENLLDYSEGYNTPFRQLSVLKNETIIFSGYG